MLLYNTEMHFNREMHFNTEMHFNREMHFNTEMYVIQNYILEECKALRVLPLAMP